MALNRDGNPNSKVMVIGMAPGKEELRTGTPFMGGSGALLWKALGKYGITRADCYILNTIAEWPLGADGNPTPEQYSKYWEEFDTNVMAFTGSVVILLGGAAMYRFMGLQGVEDWRGYVVLPEEKENITRVQDVVGEYKTNTKHHKKGDPKRVRVKTVLDPKIPTSVQHIFPTLHPAAVLRSGKTTLPAFEADVSRACRFAQGKGVILGEEYGALPFEVVGDAMAFDIETSMTGGHITDIALAGENGCFSSEWNHDAKSYTQAMALRPGVKVAHNLAFDLPRLKAAGVTTWVGDFYDTMLAAQLIQPDLYKGLNPVSSLYLDTRRWKHLSGSDPRKYNALDARRTLELYHETKRGLEITGMYELFTGTIMPTTETLINMTQRGIRVDMEFRDKWLSNLNADIKGATEKWVTLAPGVSPHSPTQLKRYLYGELGLIPQYGKYGTVTTDELALRELRGMYPEHSELFTVLLDIRDASKLAGTYAEQAIGPDGRVHPQYLPAAKDVDAYGKGMAGTGRITAKNPNIQNQPAAARCLFIPDNNMVLVEADYSQIEARVMAALAADNVLEEACKNGLHEANMRHLGVDKTRAKNAFYGWMYGAGPKTLKQTFKRHGFDVSYAECVAMLAAFDRTYAATFVYRQEIARRVNTECMLVNPFKRRRFFHNKNVPAGLDFMPQSTAADIMWSVLGPLDVAIFMHGDILACVHDSILVQVHKDHVEEGIKVLRGQMERQFDNICPGFRVPVKVKVGDNWGAMHEL